MVEELPERSGVDHLGCSQGRMPTLLEFTWEVRRSPVLSRCAVSLVARSDNTFSVNVINGGRNYQVFFNVFCFVLWLAEVPI